MGASSRIHGQAELSGHGVSQSQGAESFFEESQLEENQRQAAPAPASLPQRSVLGKWVQEVRILHPIGPIVGCMDLCEVEIGKNIQSRGPEVLQLPHH